MYRKKEENFKNIWRVISYTSHKDQKKSVNVCRWTEKRREIKKNSWRAISSLQAARRWKLSRFVLSTERLE